MRQNIATMYLACLPIANDTNDKPIFVKLNMHTIPPISASKRIDLVDALRGFAIFGILMVNMPGMFQPGVEIFMLPSLGVGTPDVLAHSFIAFFFTGKFFVLFSLLFGFGFYVFLHKHGAPGPQVVGTFQKRLFWLMVFGILHVTLLWEGDILFYYALFGFLLLLFRKSSDRKVIIWIIIFLLIPIVFVAFLSLLPVLFIHSPEAMAAYEQGNQQQLAEARNLIGRAYNIYSTGNYAEIIAMNWEQWFLLLPAIFVFYPTCMSMFLLGFIIGRKGIFQHSGQYLPYFRKAFWIALIIGIPLNVLLVYAISKSAPVVINQFTLLERTTAIFGGISFLCAYVSGFIILYHSGSAARLFSLFTAVGRMALTNYMMHSLIALLLFRSVGLGLFGKLEVWQGMVLTIVIFGVQIIFSRWWLSKFRFGPLEWLWRSLTYGKMQPFKR